MPDLDSQNLDEKLKDLADSLITSVQTKSNIYCKIFQTCAVASCILRAVVTAQALSIF